ncbi:MAG TPA: hypothetical protein VJ810_20625 [Blastocatellia bacterium]|nr:hypothetical protein [Blastocatellia bacterium]
MIAAPIPIDNITVTDDAHFVIIIGANGTIDGDYQVTVHGVHPGLILDAKYRISCSPPGANEKISALVLVCKDTGNPAIFCGNRPGEL